MYSIVFSAKTDKICKLVRTYEQPFACYKPFKLWDVFEIKRIRKFLKHIPLGLNCNYSPHSIALKQQRGVTKRLLDAVVSTLVLKQNMIICQEVILDLGRVRLGSIRDKNNWNNASKRLFGSYSHSGLSGFPFRLFCPQEQNSWNIFRNIFQNIFLFRNIPNERALRLLLVYQWGMLGFIYFLRHKHCYRYF